MSTASRAEFHRLIVFTVVGTLNTGICYALYAALVYLLGWHYNLALVADYVFGIGLGYVLHRLSTFADRKDLKLAFSKYTLTLIATFFVNLVLLDLIVRQNWLGPLWAQAIAMTIATLIGYALQKHWVFRSYPVPATTTAAEFTSATPQSRTAG